jgi:hypothetical protein
MLFYSFWPTTRVALSATERHPLSGMVRLRHIRQVTGLTTAVVAVIAFVLWPISYFSYDRVNVPLRVVHHVVVGWGNGDTVLQVVTGYGLYMDSRYWRDHHSSATDFGRGGGNPGGLADVSFGRYTLDLGSSRPRPFTAYTLHLPLWMVAVPAAIVSALCLRRRRPPRYGFEVGRSEA